MKYLLELGLTAMASSANQDNWFYGHIGACILAISFFLEEIDLKGDLTNVGLNKVKEIIGQHKEIFIDEFLNSGEKSSLDQIIDSTNENIKYFSADGHGVIYAALALKAIKKRNQNVSSSLV